LSLDLVYSGEWELIAKLGNRDNSFTLDAIWGIPEQIVGASSLIA